MWSTDPVGQAEAASSDLVIFQKDYHYLHTDHLGTPNMATDQAGNIPWKAVGESFGATEAVFYKVFSELRAYWGKLNVSRIHDQECRAMIERDIAQRVIEAQGYRSKRK